MAVDVNKVLERYFDKLASTGFSDEAVKVFVMSCMCDWKDEILECTQYSWKDIDRLCECLNGSSCLFGYECH